MQEGLHNDPTSTHIVGTLAVAAKQRPCLTPTLSLPPLTFLPDLRLPSYTGALLPSRFQSCALPWTRPIPSCQIRVQGSGRLPMAAKQQPCLSRPSAPAALHLSTCPVPSSPYVQGRTCPAGLGAAPCLGRGPHPAVRSGRKAAADVR